jgi:hypothetical protein
MSSAWYIGENQCLCICNSFRTQKSATTLRLTTVEERDVQTVRRGCWNARRQHETINAVRVKHPHKPSQQRRRDASKGRRDAYMRQPSSPRICKLRLVDMKQCCKGENYRQQKKRMPLNLLQTLFLEFQALLETKPVNHTVSLAN